MYMHTYGKTSDPAVVLLHPMGITAEKLYEIVGRKLKGSYPKWICKLIGVRDFLMLKLARSSVKLMEMAFPPELFARDPQNARQEYEQIRQYLKGYSNRTIWNIFWSANNYAVPKAAPKLDTRIQFWVGTDEWGSRFRDLKWTKRYLPQIEVVKIPNMMHGEFVMMHPEAFAEKALAFLG